MVADDPSIAVTVELVSNSPTEELARQQFLRLLARYDLRRWEFTHAVRIEDEAIPHSHPVLTLNASRLDDDDSALATYLHEQLHWFVRRRFWGRSRATWGLRRRFRRVPGRDGGGAVDRGSTYLHLIVCALEFQALVEVIGRDAACATLGRRPVYRWVYDTILSDWPSFERLLERYGLVVPG